MHGFHSPRHHRPAAAVTEPAPEPVNPAEPSTHLALLGDLAGLGRGIEFLAEGRFACTATVNPETEMIAVAPCSPDQLRELRSLYSSLALVVVDRREAAASRLIAACLGAGADAYVSCFAIAVVTAHLDAVARRLVRPHLVDRA